MKQTKKSAVKKPPQKASVKKPKVEKKAEPIKKAFSLILTIGENWGGVFPSAFESEGDTILEALNKFSIDGRGSVSQFQVGSLGAGGVLTVKIGDKKYECGFTPFQLRMLLANPDAKAIFEQKALTLLQ